MRGRTGEPWGAPAEALWNQFYSAVPAGAALTPAATCVTGFMTGSCVYVDGDAIQV